MSSRGSTPDSFRSARLHEQRWRREQGKLGALFEQTDDLIMVLDGQGQMESVNPAFCRATGWSPLEAVTRMAAIWRGPLPTRASRHLRKALNRRDGSQLLVEWSVSPILDDDGQSLNHVFIGRDVSRLQQIEDSLRENDKLRAVATLAGGIAHDFNNLLGSINGLAELCEAEAPAGSRQARNLGRIRQAGERAAELVRQMLDFSRQTPPTMQRLAVADWLLRVEALLGAALPSHHHLNVTVDNDGPVCIDLVLMEQVLMNIVRNASQAMGESAGIVRIVVDRAEPTSVLPEHTGPAHVRLRVIDSGAGIAPEILHKIFEPFFTTKPVGEGTGLGLAAVHGIVNSHDGTIEVSSEPMIGTTFSLYLPLAVAPPPVVAGGA